MGFSPLFQRLHPELASTASLTPEEGVVTADLRAGKVFHILLEDAAADLVLNHPVDGRKYTFIVAQGAGGGGLLTFQDTILWAGGEAPVFSSVGGFVDVVTLLYSAELAAYLGAIVVGFAEA